MTQRVVASCVAKTYHIQFFREWDDGNIERFNKTLRTNIPSESRTEAKIRAATLLVCYDYMLGYLWYIRLNVCYSVPIMFDHRRLGVHWHRRHLATDRDVQAAYFPRVYDFAVGLCDKRRVSASGSKDETLEDVWLTVCTRHLNLSIKKGLTCSGSRLARCPILT